MDKSLEENKSELENLKNATNKTSTVTDEDIRKKAAVNTDLDALKRLMDLGNATKTMWDKPPDS